MIELRICSSSKSTKFDEVLRTTFSEVPSIPMSPWALDGAETRVVWRLPYFELAEFATPGSLLAMSPGRVLGATIVRIDSTEDKNLAVIEDSSEGTRLLELTRGPGPERIFEDLVAISELESDVASGSLHFARGLNFGFQGWVLRSPAKVQVWPTFPGRLGLDRAFVDISELVGRTATRADG